MIPERIRHLIEKYTSDTLTPEERQELHAWYQRKANNDVRWEFKPSEDERELERRMFQRVRDEIAPSDRFARGKLLNWCASAALVLLIVSTGLYFWPGKHHDEPLVFSNQHEHENRFVLLSDSSKVVLKPDSRLTVRFSQDVRLVELQGEAFFDVAHSADTPFVVRTGRFQTKVLGTEFLLKYQKGRDLAVSVKQGKVAVFQEDENHELALLHAEEGLYAVEPTGLDPLISRTTKLGLRKVTRDLKWIQDDLKFSEIPLQDLVKRLEDRYQETIRIADPELGLSRINGAFEGTEPLDSVLKTITELTGTRLSKLGKTYVINRRTDPKGSLDF